MTWTPGRRSLTPTVYLAIVILGGGVALTLSILSLLGRPPGGDFYYLAILIVISGYVSVKLPNVSANISVSETFIFTGLLLYGPPAGTLLVFLDALLIWANLARRNLRWYRMLFSLAASALSIGIAGTVLFRVAGTAPLAVVPVANRPELLSFAGGLIAFVGLYYGLNSSLIAFAISHEQQIPARVIWQKNFSRLWLNYLAGASIALLLVYNTQGLTWAFLIVVLPVIVVLFLTYQWSGERIERAERHVEEMNRTFLETIEAMAMAIDAKDQVTSGHIRRVQRNAMAVARELGVTDTRSLDALRAAALLHDTGKLAVPEHILNKPGRLTPAEFNRMKLHSTIGADILKSISFPYPVVPLVRHHHENWDGTGYPDGLRGQDIPLGARILAVVDCFDAVTSDRPYRSRMTRAQAEQILLDRRGTMYDPLVVDAFLRILHKLEAADATDEGAGRDLPAPIVGIAEELRAIAATRVEDREFSSLKRDLPSATTISAAAELVFRHVTPLVPSATLVIYAPVPDADELAVLACTGTRATAIRTLVVPIGERMAGWVFANREVVVNSEAALDLGTIARGASPPLEYALVVPVLESDRAVGVLAVYGPEPFNEDQQRIVESAADLLRLTILSAPSPIRNAVD